MKYQDMMYWDVTPCRHQTRSREISHYS